MKFFIAFALVAAVAAVPVKFQPDQVIFVNDVPNDIFARLDFGPAIVDHELIVNDLKSQLFNAEPNQMFVGDLPKPSPVMVVNIAEVAERVEAAEASEPIEAVEAVQVVDAAEDVEAVQDVEPVEAAEVVDFAEAVKVAEDAVAVDPVQVFDITDYIEALEAAQADEAAEIAEISEIARAVEIVFENAQNVEADQDVEVAQDAPSPVEISENIPEIIESIVLAESSLPEVASDILY